MLRRNASAFIDFARSITLAIFDGIGPNQIAIALHDGMRAAEFQGFVGVEGGVDPSENYKGAALPRHSPQGVSAEGVAGVDADPHHIAGLDPRRVQALQRL